MSWFRNKKGIFLNNWRNFFIVGAVTVGDLKQLSARDAVLRHVLHANWIDYLCKQDIVIGVDSSLKKGYKYLCIILHNMTASPLSFFKELGLEEKESRILMTSLRLGSQPASVIANRVKLDRTTTYRILRQLCRKKLLKQSSQKGVTTFYIEKIGDIRHYISSRQNKYAELERTFDKIAPELDTLRSSVQELPRIQIYDGFERLETFYHDVVERTIEQKLIIIRILGSNTFSQKLERKDLGGVVKKFGKELIKHHIETEVLIAQGNLTREWLTQLGSFDEMEKLPAAGGATNVILVGESIFMVSFRDFPVGIRIDHPDLAQTMHFLFDIGRKRIKK